MTAPLAVLDASPSRERLGRVVELLRGVEDDLSTRRPPPRRRAHRPVALRPVPVLRAEAQSVEPVA